MPRPKPIEGIKLQSRDRAILRTILDGRVMTIKHAAALHFSGSFEAAKKRLQKLQAAGLVAMRPRLVQQPAIYSLTRDGYMNLKEEGMLDPLLELGWEKMRKRLEVSDLMLRHELAAMDVKAAMAAAIEKLPGVRIVEFSICAERHAFNAVYPLLNAKKFMGFRSGVVKPDGYLEVSESKPGENAKTHCFYLEVDRGTESLHRLAKKAGKYAQHYRKGGFAVRRGLKRENHKEAPFRLMIILPSAERRNNVAELLLKTKETTRGMAWLATMPDLLADPLGSIWLRPSDYQAIPRLADWRPPAQGPVYKRRSEREAWIEAKGGKRRLFE